jgi:type III secretion protein R
MQLNAFDPITLALALALLALVPTIVVISTTFLKIAVVMSLVRNALGIQQIPPNLALYGLALILTFYIMAPVGQRIFDEVAADPAATRSVEGLYGAVKKGAEPLREFMVRHTASEHTDFFVQTARKLWGAELAAEVSPRDFVVLVPAAFEIGFLLFLPFVVIDLIVSNILLAMGMMMVSPVMISLPLKLFLFVMVDGWSRLIRGLVLTYT